MSGSHEEYKAFEVVNALRQEVSALVRRQHAVVLGMGVGVYRDRWLTKLDDMAVLVENDSFKVLIVGQFSRGKSTFINALLGQKILPSYATPTTAVINEVKFGEKPAVLLYPRPTADDANPLPTEVPIDSLEDYVTVRFEDKDKPNLYARVEVFWPIDLCRNGVELIDSPGLDDVDLAREAETIAYLQKVDAVVMMLDAQQPASRAEVDFFSDVVSPLGHEDVFWVVNKINFVGNDRSRVEEHVTRTIGPLVQSEDRIFFVNALGALEAKAAGDNKQLKESGLPLVESALQEFLTVRRGRAKVLLPVRQLQLALHEVRQGLSTEEGLLDRNYQELVLKAHALELPLAKLEDRARYLSTVLEQEIAILSTDLDRLTDSFLSNFPETMVCPFPSTELSPSPRHFKKSTDLVMAELAKELHKKVQQQLVDWMKDEYGMLLRTRLQVIQHRIRDDVRDFENELKGLRLDLTSGHTDVLATEVGFLGSTPADGVTSSLVLQGLASAAGGATVGGVVGVVATVLVSGMGLGLAAPVVIVGAAAWSAWWMLFQDGTPVDALIGALRKKVLARAKEQFLEGMPRLREQVQTNTSGKLHTVASDFRSDLNAHVVGLREEVRLALWERTKGDESVQARKSYLREQVGELREIEKGLDGIVDRVLALDARPPLNA